MLSKLNRIPAATPYKYIYICVVNAIRTTTSIRTNRITEMSSRLPMRHRLLLLKVSERLVNKQNVINHWPFQNKCIRLYK